MDKEFFCDDLLRKSLEQSRYHARFRGTSENATGPASKRREHGELTHWTQTPGFGFITPLVAGKKDASTDIFIHRSCLRAAGINEPVRGMLLDYVVGLGDNGRERVVRVWSAAEIVR